MNKVVEFLQANPVQYLATVGRDGKAKCRPFMFCFEKDGKLWFCTNNTKDVYKDMQENPEIEISVSSPEYAWIRLHGKAVFENNMEVKRICQWCGKPFIAKKTTTNYCSHQCASQGYKHRMRERRLELRELQDLIEVKSKLDHQDYFTFAQAAQLMGVSRQYIYKLVKEDKLRASRISARMSIIRLSLIHIS